ncbi:TIGR03089 family protein [Candidatus Frankia nodulisporulans]|uniref:TIGR03089 family protein n=1 Tax=Candidatus Frankia nodulisporulans TaxID=2060052 RepID=UPI001CDBA69C|nr:TIGR03089 family protein [Candidatus Frankia nodulisporulans]
MSTPNATSATSSRLVRAADLILAAPAVADDEATSATGTGLPGVGARGIADLLARRLAADPSRPLVTFYDDETGERVEFSATTLDNWVAKTANMLVDTLGLGPGDRVGMDLPPHWLALVIALATWSAGGDLVVAQQPTDQQPTDQPSASSKVAALAPTTPLHALFVAQDRLDAAADLDVDETVALSLRPLGGRMTRSIPGVLDYAVEVPSHGDRFGAPPPPSVQADLVRRALRTAVGWRLGASDRLLVTATPSSTTGLLGGLLAPLSAGASVVLCRRLDPDLLIRRIEAERVTAIVTDTPTVDGPAVDARSGWPGEAAAGVRVLRLPVST